MRQSLFLGYLMLTFAQVAISMNVVVSKFLLESLPMFSFLTLRFGISTLLLALGVKLSNQGIMHPLHPQGALSKHDWFLAILQGIFAAFLFNLFFVWGLQHTSATAAGIVSSSLPAIIALCALWWLKESLTRAKVFSLGLAMLGILVININPVEGVDNVEHTYWGDLLILIAMFPEAWYSIISRKLATRMSALGAALIANAVGFVTLLLCALFTQSAFNWIDFTWQQTFLLFLSGLSGLIFFWGWGWGLSFIPASTAAIFGGIMPLATTLFAIIFLGEVLSWYDIVGMLFVISSIFIGARWRLHTRPVNLSE